MRNVRRVEGPRSRPYRLPRLRGRRHYGRDVLSVDAPLDDALLDRLNTIPQVVPVSTCVGHPRGAHIGFTLGPRLSWSRLRARLRAAGHHAHHNVNYGLTTYWLEPTGAPPPEGGLAWFRRAVADLDGMVRSLLAEPRVRQAT